MADRRKTVGVLGLISCLLIPQVAVAQTVSWTVGFGDGSYEVWAWDNAIDLSDNAVIVGTTKGPLFGPMVSNEQDCYVASLDKNGRQRWSIVLPVLSSVACDWPQVAREADGSILVLAYEGRGQQPPPDDCSDSEVGSLWRIDPATGDVIGSSKVTTENGLSRRGHSLVALPDGGAIVAGLSWCDQGLALVRMDAELNVVWDAFEDNMVLPYSVTFDPKTSRTYVAGSETNRPNGQEAYVAGFDVNGNLSWEKYLDSEYESMAYFVAVDHTSATGDIYVSGRRILRDTFQNANIHLTFEASLHKLSLNGELKWSRHFDRERQAQAWDIVIDASGNAVVLAEFGNLRPTREEEVFQFEPSIVDALLLTYSTNGDVISEIVFGSPDNDFPVAMSLDSQGDIYVTMLVIATTAVATFSDQNIQRSLVFVDSAGTEPRSSLTKVAQNSKRVPRGKVGSEAGVTLTVSKRGIGKVTSTPKGIDCGRRCDAIFPSNSTVTLTAAPARGGTFLGWQGDCSGSSPTCTVTMSRARAVSAVFGP